MNTNMPKVDMLHEIKVLNGLTIAAWICLVLSLALMLPTNAASLLLFPVALIVALIALRKQRNILSTVLYTAIDPKHSQEDILKAMAAAFDEARMKPVPGEGTLNYRKDSLMNHGSTLSASVAQEGGELQAILWVSNLRYVQGQNGTTNPNVKGLFKAIKKVCTGLATYAEGGE